MGCELFLTRPLYLAFSFYPIYTRELSPTNTSRNSAQLRFNIWVRIDTHFWSRGLGSSKRYDRATHSYFWHNSGEESLASPPLAKLIVPHSVRYSVPIKHWASLQMMAVRSPPQEPRKTAPHLDTNTTLLILTAGNTYPELR